MNARTFLEIDHSGDAGIEAWGRTLAELLQNATRGLFALMVWGEVESVVVRRVSVDSANPGDLIVDWLSEVILCAATHGEVYSAVEVQSADEGSASGVIRGARVDPARHALRFDVKAATYHGLVCERTEDGYHARIIFDL